MGCGAVRQEIIVAKFNMIGLGSKIILAQEQSNRIIGFFNKNILKLKLLYRASENQFSAKKFHLNCDNIPNTLIICQTESQRKLGGFTPLTWQTTQNQTPKADSFAESFIFSVTHNDKFTLQDKEHAITNHKDIGPLFGYANLYGGGVDLPGGPDLFICDKSNSNYWSSSDINQRYKNSGYKAKDQKSWERFCGNPQFKVVEWEVWQVEFA